MTTPETPARAAAAVPHHVAIVMDGNDHWAKCHGLPRAAGREQGVQALLRCIRACMARGVRALTVFAFPAENLSGPAQEAGARAPWLAEALAREAPGLGRAGVRLHFVGERDSLESEVRQALAEAEASTQDNDKLALNVCCNHGARQDIAQAARRLTEWGVPITEEALGKALALAHVPDPDLLIRTAGERRVGNFLLWQIADSELFFSDRLWPDFDEAALDEAFAAYAGRGGQQRVDHRALAQPLAQGGDAAATAARAASGGG
ncbi:MAG: di-trans,poly-cis-decaprenylcistransferase [Burkholderiaceae bacterium]|jgi:undecaprenyl diphosphate synthase|nr:di-trans,poly-cis-decaprenylcistransferase [Burkholderiaceae bacterium]